MLSAKCQPFSPSLKAWGEGCWVVSNRNNTNAPTFSNAYSFGHTYHLVSADERCYLCWGIENRPWVTWVIAKSTMLNLIKPAFQVSSCTKDFIYITVTSYEHHVVSDHWQLNCYFNSLLKLSIKMSKLRITGMPERQWCAVGKHFHVMMSSVNIKGPGSNYVNEISFNIFINLSS